jgi:hypothetical protein
LDQGKTIVADEIQNVKPHDEFGLFVHHDNEP